MSLNIELIAIGNEVLSGTTVNSNAAFISVKLFESGFKVTSHIAIPDEPETLKNKLTTSVINNEIVIATGGLGPTCDDNTRNAIANIFNSKLVLNTKIEQELIKRYPNKNIASKDQATIPDNATPLDNPIGTAPGLYLTKNNSHIFFLPGVPLEMQYILENSVIPILNKNFIKKSTEYISKLYFFQVTESEADPVLRELKQKYNKIDFGIYPNLGITTIHIISNLDSEKENISYQNPIIDILKKKFDNRFFSDKTSKLQNIIAEKLSNKSISIAQTALGCNLITLLNLAEPKMNLASVTLASDEYFAKKFDLNLKNPENFAIELANNIKKIDDADIIITITNIDESKNIQNNQPPGIITIITTNETKQYELPLWGNLETVYKRGIHFCLAKLYLIT